MVHVTAGMVHVTNLTPGSECAPTSGSITFTVLSCDVKAGTVKVRCENSAKLGERKNMNLPGVNVDLPTITVGLYKLRIQFTYSLKAPGFNP